MNLKRSEQYFHKKKNYVTYVEGKLDAVGVLRHTSERFRSAASGVIRAPVQYGAVWNVGGRWARINVTNRNDSRAWPLAAAFLVDFNCVLKSLSDFST